MNDSLLSKVKNISIVTKKSKAGNDYQMLQVTFANGYVYESYVKPEQLFIINSMK